MGQYRSYQDVKAILETFNVEFTGKAQADYRKTPSAFASRAQYWSEARFGKELQYLIQKNNRRDRYQSLRQLNVNTKEAKAASTFSKTRYNNYLKARQYTKDDHARTLSKDPNKLSQFIKKVRYDKIKSRRIRDKVTLSRRDDTWAYWSRLRNHPDEIRQEAYRINQEAFKVDMDAKPGWAVMYYHYKYNIDIDTLIEETDFNRYLPDVYVTHVKQLLS